VIASRPGYRAIIVLIMGASLSVVAKSAALLPKINPYLGAFPAANFE
jgi:hypothetical protein